jgi:hypothetical protein
MHFRACAAHARLDTSLSGVPAEHSKSITSPESRHSLRAKAAAFHLASR